MPSWPSWSAMQPVQSPAWLAKRSLQDSAAEAFSAQWTALPSWVWAMMVLVIWTGGPEPKAVG